MDSEKLKPLDLDEYQEEIGGVSRYQIVLVLIAGILTFGSGFTSQSAVFLSAVPQHRCAVPPIDECDNLTEAEINNLTIPYNPVEAEYDSCTRYNYNLTACTCDDFSCLDEANPIPQACDNGYYYDRQVYTETTVSQFNLVCDRQSLDSLANTLFFLGFFIGSFFIGPLSDWFGRKFAMRVTAIGLIAFGSGCSFSPTYEVYVVLRVFQAAFGITCFISMYTYTMEIVVTKWRSETGAYANMTTAFSHSIYPGIAYFIRDWHYLNLTICLVPIPFLILSFFIPESPRWLMTKGRFDEARVVVEKYAKSKKTVLDDETWERIVKTEEEKKNVDGDKKDNEKIGFWDFFRRPLMRFVSVNVMISWFTISMVFYGLALNGGNLSGDPYLNNALNGLVEIAAFAFVYVASGLGRKPTMAVSYIMSGVCCITSMLFDINADGKTELFTASTAFAISGKFFASIGFCLVYSVTSELFPTNARVSGLSMGSMAARVGSMITPFTLQLQSTVPWATQTIFGVLSITSGLLVILYPETGKADYLHTLDEAEDFYWENMAVAKCFKRKSTNGDNEVKVQVNDGFIGDDEKNVQTRF